MQSQPTRPNVACGIGPFHFARTRFDRCGRRLLRASASESVETFRRWRTNVDVDGRAVVEVGQKGAFARVVLAAFLRTGRNENAQRSNAERREASHLSWVSWNVL
jgi:hypothetical protein